MMQAAEQGWDFPADEQTLESWSSLLADQGVDLVVFALFAALVLVSFFRKSPRLKSVALVASVVYLGILKSQLLSIVNVFGLITFNLPVFRYNLAWYVFAAFAVATTVLWGRIYCGRVCAFGAMTQLLDRVVPARWRWSVPRALERRAGYVKYAILAVVLGYFVTTHDSSVYRYVEPFWMFGGQASAPMWIGLGVLLSATVFIRNLYCRFLCPLGAALGLLSSLTVFRIKRWQECNTCRICEKACEWGAIQGPAIIKRECVRCDDCERLYADTTKCPHHIILLRRSGAAVQQPASVSRVVGRLVIPLALWLCVSCNHDSLRRSHIVERVHPAMGADVRLSAWTADERAALAAFDLAFAEVDRLESIMSVWRNGSEVQRLNNAAGQHRVVIGRDMQRVLREARQVSEWTGGKFDVTFGALNGLWKFDHDQDNIVPDRAVVRARLPLIDYKALNVDDASRTAFLPRAGMRVHLGGIGKGYAVDRAVEILRSHGLRDFMIQSGGDLFVSGTRGERPWRVAIRDPRGPVDRTIAALDLTNGTFSTSGDYERFFIKDGQRYHHILDPDTGDPARGCQSVTIVAESAAIADGLSTGVFILGPAAGMALIEKLPHVEGVIVTDHGEMLVSTGLEGQLAR